MSMASKEALQITIQIRNITTGKFSKNFLEHTCSRITPLPIKSSLKTCFKNSNLLPCEKQTK